MLCGESIEAAAKEAATEAATIETGFKNLLLDIGTASTQ